MTLRYAGVSVNVKPTMTAAASKVLVNQSHGSG